MLVPDEWRKGVTPSQGIPAPGADEGAWNAFADALAGDLDDANGREAQTIAIVEKCEAHDAALVKSLNHKPFLGLF